MEIQKKNSKALFLNKNTTTCCAVIPTWNSEKYISGALVNLLESEGYKQNRVGICVVDTGSKDGTLAIVNKFLDENKNIELISIDEKKNPHWAWNYGIHNNCFDTDYILQYCSDDRISHDFFEHHFSILDIHKDISMTYANQYVAKENGGFLKHSLSAESFYCLPQFNPSVLSYVCLCSTQPMFRKELEYDNGPFGAQYESAGDYDFYLRAISNGAKFYRIPELLGSFLMRDDSCSNKDQELSKKEREEIIEKYKHIRTEVPPPFIFHLPVSILPTWDWFVRKNDDIHQAAKSWLLSKQSIIYRAIMEGDLLSAHAIGRNVRLLFDNIKPCVDSYEALDAILSKNPNERVKDANSHSK